MTRQNMPAARPWSQLLRASKPRRTTRRSAIGSLESLEARQMLAGTPVLTEFMAQNNSGITDEDGSLSDWIEVHNPDPANLDLTGWHLTDNDNLLTKWTFPPVTLTPGQRLVVWASGKDRPGTGPEGEYHTNFSLGAGGEYLALVHPNGTTIAQEFVSSNGEFPQQHGDISYGLAPITSEETYFLTPTPGAANSGPTSSDPARRIAINEIMFHPSSENIAEEYIELYNYGPTGVPVGGWYIEAVEYTIPAGRIMDSGTYLVIAADVPTFQAKYPSVNPAIVIGGWTDRLANRYETIELEDNFGDRVDVVDYAEQGDWANRVRPVADIYGHQGWAWSAPHDGGGSSLELINPLLSNNQGQNWAASITSQGTPGAANSVADANIAPLISDVAHFPAVPRSTDPITITAELRDELTTGVAATLRWRVDRANNTDPFLTATMFDDGAHGDGAAGDGLWGATLIPQANGTIIEFYVRATDSSSNVRTWPAPTDGVGTQGANALLQVDDAAPTTFGPGSFQTLLMIMTEDERAELADIGDGAENPGGEIFSDALMNGTFISLDGNGAKVRYRSGFRNRGGGSRSGPPNNYHVSLPHDNTWNGDVSLSVNSRYPHGQVLGTALFQFAGQPAEDSTPISARVNGVNLATSGNVMFGHYALNETRNSDFTDHHFPGDGNGNFYTITNDFGDQGDLRYEGPDPDAYRDAYYKQTNEELDDWSDLINLTQVLDQAPSAGYLAAIQTVVDLPQWMRHFAVDTLLANREGGMQSGQGDDFLLYSGEIDPRFKLIPHDLDTLLGFGGVGFVANSSIFGYEGVNGIARFFTHPDVVPLYFKEILAVADTIFAPEFVNPLVDQVMGGWVAAATIQQTKDNLAARRAYVKSILPTNLTLNTTLSSLGGFARTTDGQTVNLSGTSHIADTRSVTVGGTLANWNPRTGQWTLATMPLNPGINRLYVRSWDAAGGTGNVLAERFIDIWNDSTTGTGITLNLAAGATGWLYRDNGVTPPADGEGDTWTEHDYDDTTTPWPSGTAELGYGDAAATVVDCGPDPNIAVCSPGNTLDDNYITTYFRKHFTINAGNAARYDTLDLGVIRDDGIVVYVNGREVWRDNLPASPAVITNSTLANTSIAGTGETTFVDAPQIDLTAPQWAGLLHDGDNVVTAEIHQNAADSSDISFNLRMTLTEQTVGTGTNLSGTIATDRTLTAAAGPYHVVGDVTVPAGVTLTIEPGASIFFAQDTQMNINGRLVAEGTANNWIRFTREPNTTANWDGLQFVNSMQDNRLSYAVLEWSTHAGNQGMLGLSASTLTVDNSYFDHSLRRRIRSQNSNLSLKNSIFTDVYPPNPQLGTVLDNVAEHIWGGGIPTGGYWIVENNIFGATYGHNDSIDFDAPTAAGQPLAQMIGNTFLSGGDDFTDMTGHVLMEGNRFFNIHKDAHNIATGDMGQSNVNSSSTGDYWSARNIYYNIDHATLTKETSFTTFENNTVVNADLAPIYFDLAGETSGPGRGADVDASIFTDLLTGVFTAVLPTTELTLDYSIVPTAADAAVRPGTGNLVLTDPHLTNVAGLDFSLAPGSPAKGTGPNGIDMGAMVAAGATIGGEPAAITHLTTAALTIDGPNVTHYRYSLDGGAFTVSETPVSTPLSLTGLSNGAHSVRVIGKNAAGVWQSQASAAISKTWTVQTTGTIPIQVIINEVLADNRGVAPLGATNPDIIELYNAGDSVANLEGLGITDNADIPYKYAFPAGVTIPARGHITLYADSLPSQSGEIHLGFGLDSDGDNVTLFNTFAAGGAILDQIEFGIQIPNHSIGRLPGGGEWGLAQPTFGGTNRSQPLAMSSSLKVNEWFTSGSYTINGDVETDDFIELYNTSPFPAALGGLHLTDNPADDPTKHEIGALSFIAGQGYSVFQADGTSRQEANHANFRLTAERGWIGLSEADGDIIDQVMYLPQVGGYSQGRAPDGGPAYQFFAQPSPGLDSSPPSVPGNLRFTLTTPTQYDIAWDASTDVQTGVANYNVYRGGILLGSTTDLTYSDATAVSGVSYAYQVSAVNGHGFESALSSSLSTGIDNTPPSTPTGLAGTIAGPTQINFTWNASTDPQTGVQNYRVYKNGLLVGSPVGTSFNDTSFAAGPTIQYRVSAVNNDDVESPLSLSVFAATFQDGVAPSVDYGNPASPNPQLFPGTIDTWINENTGQQGVNHGTNTVMRFDGEDPLEEIAFLRWNITSIPNDATVSAASVTVNVTNHTGGQTYEFYEARKNWAETQANFTLAATGLAWQTAGARGATDRGTAPLGNVATSATGSNTHGLNAAGVTLVEQWVRGTTPNFGMLISDDPNTDGSTFDSSEVATATNRPRLTVLYTTPPPADLTPPTVPNGVSATNNGASTITVSWNPASDPDSGVASYKVYRNGTLAGTSIGVTFQDNGRTPGVSYSYTVSAVNNVSLESAQSSPPANHSIAVDSTPPNAPTDLVAGDNGISQITLNWTAAADVQSGISQYRVFRDNSLVGTSTTTSFTDVGLLPNTAYSYRVSAVNGQNLEGLSSSTITHEIEPLPLSLTLQTRGTYLPGVPILVRVEITGADGLPDKTIWDATATLTTSNPGVTLDNTSVQLRNGVGTTLVTPTGSGNFILFANIAAMGLSSSKAISTDAGITPMTVSGTLSGAQLNWSNVVNVTGNVIVPDGQVLNVAPGTLVVVTGAPDNRPNLVTNGITITVNGRMNAVGTSAQPITFTSNGVLNYWGEINHATSDGTSQYAYVDVLHAGHSPGGDHTGHGPAIRTSSSTINFDHTNITDIVGKTMRAQGSNLTFTNSIFQRSAMGPETFSTGILFRDSYIFDMLVNYRQDNVNDDDDGIYVHRQSNGQEIRFEDCIVANTGDDGIDQLGADIIVDGCIIRDMINVADDPKGITIIAGTNIIRNTLIVNVDIGISIKIQNPADTSNNTVDHVTVIANSIALQAEDKYGVPTAILNYNVSNSILRAPDAIRTDYDPAPIIINYSNISEVWPGTGNITDDPLFVNPAARDYHLTAASPAIDAGNPASPPDPDGTRTDMGVYPFFHHARIAEVLVRGTSWSPAMLARLENDSLGSGGYSVPIETGPLRQPLSWTNLNQIRIRFTEGVVVSQNMLQVKGVNVPNYSFAPGGFSYDAATFTATWTLTQSIGIDKIRVVLDDTVLDLTGSPMDGDLGAAFPSGNSTPGGDFSFRFDVLPGDVDQNRAVDSTDFQNVRQSQFSSPIFAAYTPRRDLDGNAAINILDWQNTFTRIGTTLPGGEPAPSPPAPSAPAAVVVRAADAMPAHDALDAAIIALTPARPVQPNRISATRLSTVAMPATSHVDNALAEFSGDETPVATSTRRVLESRRGSRPRSVPSVPRALPVLP